MDERLADAGGAVTAGLITREIDPARGDLPAVGHGDDEPCANCGTTRYGPYCHACGQAGHVHRTAGALVHDIGHGVFHFEGRIWHTLPLLALRPGELTRRYVHGERAKFVPPMALFLFSVFLMFAVVSNLADGPRVQVGRPAARAIAQFPGDLKVETGWHRLDDAVAHAAQNPDLLLYKMKSYGYKYSWALIQISLPFLWLLFAFRRDVGLYDHAIFAIYSIAFMSLGVVMLSLLGRIGVPDVLLVPAALCVPPLHMYRQLRDAYRLSRFGAGWRTAALLAVVTVTSSLYVALLFYLGSE